MKILIGLLLFISVPVFADIANNCTPVTQTDNNYGVSSPAAATLAAVQNTRRRCLIIQNKSGASSVWIQFTPASQNGTTKGMILTAGSIYNPVVPPLGAIYINSAAGVVNCYVMDGN